MILESLKNTARMPLRWSLALSLAIDYERCVPRELCRSEASAHKENGARAAVVKRRRRVMFIAARFYNVMSSVRSGM
jgi:hypothetical protein